MDVVQLVSEQATSVSLAIVIMWFYNKLVQDILIERKEMIEEIKAERKEWLAQTDRYLNQLFDVTFKSTDTMAKIGAEVHALRGKLTEFMLTLGKEKGIDTGTK